MRLRERPEEQALLPGGRMSKRHGGNKHTFKRRNRISPRRRARLVKAIGRDQKERRGAT